MFDTLKRMLTRTALFLSALVLTYCTIPNPEAGEALSEREFEFDEKRGNFPAATTVCYGRQNGGCSGYSGPRRATLYRPTGASKGVVVYVHGGLWEGSGAGISGRSLTSQGAHGAPKIALSRSRPTGTQQWLGTGGWTVLSIDYSSATPSANQFPGALHDVKVAMRYARRYHTQSGQRPLVVMGHSAGGHLASLAALASDARFSTTYPSFLSSTITRADGVVSLGGPLDFVDWIRATNWDLLDRQVAALSQNPNGLEAHVASNALADYLRCYPYTALGRGLPRCIDHRGWPLPVVLDASPSNHYTSSAPPMYAAYGANDAWVVPGAACYLGSQYYQDGRAKYFWSDLVDVDAAGKAVGSNHTLAGVNAQYLGTFLNHIISRVAGDDTFPDGNWPSVPTVCNP